MAKLTVRGIDALKSRDKPYAVGDGNRLMLIVQPGGSKNWVVRTTIKGRKKRPDIGIGGYPTVALSVARETAAEVVRLAREGTDWRERQKQKQDEQRTAERQRQERVARTFRSVALNYIKAQAPGWKNKRTASIWVKTLERHAFPTLGDVPVANVDRAAIRQAVDQVWTSRPATARKIVQRIGVVLRHAAANGWSKNETAADIDMLRHAGLSPLPGGRKRPSLSWQVVPAFLRSLDGMKGFGPLALRFLVLTAVRSGEARGARWSELSFDRESVLWTIPGERMKARKTAEVLPHRVPLSRLAVDTLARAYHMATGVVIHVSDLSRMAALMGNSLIFPGGRRDRPMSDMALSSVIRKMNGDTTRSPWRDLDGRDATVHGFRATFRTWVDDVHPGDAAAAEKALAHEDPNRVAAVYRRSDLLDRRIPLMEAWADLCEGNSQKIVRAVGREG